MPRLLHYSDIENVYDDPVRVGRLAGTLRDLNGPDTVVCGTGDNTSPGVLALIDRGRQALDLFEAIEADVATFGNHDFDYGPDATRALVADAPQTWVSANVYDADGERFAADDVVAWTVVTVDGVRIGFFGVTDPATASLNPMAADLQFTDPYDAAERAVAALHEAGVDRIVALSHLDATGPIRIDRHATADGAVVEGVVSALHERVAAAGLDEGVAHVDDPIDRTDAAVFGGEPIDPDAEYTVATSAYLLHTTHEFPTLGERHRTGEGDIQFEVLSDYARAAGIDPEIEGRIRRIGTGATA